MINHLIRMKMIRFRHSRWVTVAFTLALLFDVCTAESAAAVPAVQPVHIVILQSAAGGPYEEFTRRFRQTMQDADPTSVSRITVLTPGNDATRQLANLSNADLLVAVGTQATETALHSKTLTPILSVLVPRYTADQLASAAGNPSRKITTIYLDQPMSRYFALIRLVMPHTNKVGIILGPVTKTETAELNLSARQSRITPLFAIMPPDNDNPLPALEKILRSSDVLLALPDPVVYNRYTLPPLLLTTFRYRVPVFGFSEALVNAGAMAGVYSQPEQIGQQAAEMILHHALPAGGRYPRYFQVSFNQAVANALDILLPDQKRVEDLLKKQIGAQ